MRNSKSHSKTIRSKLSKCSSIFNAFSDIQYRYGLELDKRSDIKEIKVNVNIMGDTYTTDFYCIKSNKREIFLCLYKFSAKLRSKLTYKLIYVFLPITCAIPK